MAWEMFERAEQTIRIRTFDIGFCEFRYKAWVVRIRTHSNDWIDWLSVDVQNWTKADVNTHRSTLASSNLALKAS